MAQASRVPKLVAGVSDLRSLPLAPVDGFVLSRINGALTVRDIATGTGLGEDVVEGSLGKLRSLGLIQFEGDTDRRPSTPKAEAAPAQADSSGSFPTASASKTFKAGPQISSDLPPRFDPREVDEDCDLTVEERKRVLMLFYELEDLDHYRLLGIARDAGKKDIKRAYFELASSFHPDKFFRKRLGSFKQKMEVIFGRVTEAHDTLTSKEKRPEYDAYLDAQAEARGIEAAMDGARAEAQRAQEDLRREAPSIEPLAPTSGPPTPQASSAPPRAGSSPDLRPMARSDTRELREALARRLTGVPPRGAPTPKPQPVPIAPVTAQGAMDALRRRFDDRRTDAARAQARRHRDAGDAARAKGDIVAAATAYRIALSFATEDEDLKKLFQETQAAADGLLAETYLKQATYEERNGHWPEAARSWARVAKARREDARAHDRLAHALVEAQGNLHEAADAAKRAVELAPAVVAFRVTLASVYLAAGLTIAAKREADGAAKMSPNDPDVQALLKRLQKTT